MRIGIDGSCLANRRGFGRFARQVLDALAEMPNPHEFVVFIDRPSAATVSVPDRFETVLVDVGEAPTSAASATGRRRVRDMLSMGKAVAGAGIDLIYFPATYTFFPVWNVKHVVVTMHDTLALAHPDLVFPTWQGRLSWMLKEHAAACWADRIVTVSESARRDLIAWFRLPAEKICVVSEGPGEEFRPRPRGPESDAVLARYGLAPGTRYVLYVGGLSPHKNLSRLIEAFSGAAPSDVQLVLVGDTGDVFHTHVPELRAAVERFGLVGRVHFTGFVPDDDLAYLYSRAYVLAQPSLMEGFGLPPVEAMACGTPVISSTAGSLPEVVGDAGIFFDPTEVAAIAGAVRRIFEDPVGRDELASTAFRRASQFTWANSARALLAAFGEFDPGWDPRQTESMLNLSQRSTRGVRREPRALVEAKLPVSEH
ncbi:glycosyltransferase family 1 protein [Singulisphaera sp. Ch08]|uniref:Glycosyltransferase family 1 protein n=1 Tax=Singulisphaera sp. Ch08 TaxID=3120278 RepID=A0AAU7C748_9BACT